MSVIIRLQNLPWSANALDIRNYFRGLSIPEGGVHIVGGELGDAFIAFSTDEDARQAMMLDGGKIKEIQVKLHLSSRSEMHKVIESARQTVPILTLTAPAAPVAPVVVAPVEALPIVPVAPSVPTPPLITPFSAVLGNSISNYGIPGIGNPQEIPQPAVIEPPAPMLSPPVIITPEENDKDEEKSERKRSKEKDRRKSRSRSRSRDRDRKDRKRDRRDRSRSRDRERKDRKRDRRDRSRSRDRRRRDRSRSRDRSPSRRSRDRRNNDRKPSPIVQEKPFDNPAVDTPLPPPPPAFNASNPISQIQLPPVINNPMMLNGPVIPMEPTQNRFADPSIADAYNKLQELGKKRNPNAFQGEQQNGAGRFPRGRGGGGLGGRGGSVDGHMGRNAPPFRRDGRQSRFENEPQRDCCVAIKNAPNHTSYGDVRRFFPFMIDKHGIKMINDNMGRRTGNIFVRFCEPRSKNLAIQRKNNELKGAEVNVEDLDDESYEAAIDSFLPYREENDAEDQSLVIIDSNETSRKEFSVLKLTDLPHFVKEHDIIKIFSDFSLLSIMLNDCRVTRTKVAFVQFVKSADARQAFEQKERYMFGRRQPTITPVTNEEYEKEKIVQNEKEPELVPQKEQIEVDPPPRDREPVVPRDPRQRRPQFDNGTAQQAQPPQPQPYFPTPFAQGQPFATPFAAQPFSTFPGNAMDPRTAAANWANRPTLPNPMPAPARNQNIIDLDDEPLDCVLMKGLPSETSDRTIVSFLSDTGAVPARIHLMLDTNSMPSGDCFCEFRTTQEARMAATKHGHDLDGNRVTVDLVARSVVEEALEGPKQSEVRNSPSLLGNGVPQPQFYDAPRGGYQPRGSYRGRGYDRGFDRGGYSGRGFGSGRGGFDSVRGGFDSGRGGFESGRGGFESGRGAYDSGRSGFDSGRGFRGRASFDRGNRFDRGRGRGFSRGRGGFEGGRGGLENGRDREVRDEEQDPALEDFGAPGCVVSMENVPFRAAVEDIMNFFSEFELTQDDIIRRYNERGQPTGDARVAFRTPFDAQRAVKTRHMDTIHDRRINLTIL